MKHNNIVYILLLVVAVVAFYTTTTSTILTLAQSDTPTPSASPTVEVVPTATPPNTPEQDAEEFRTFFTDIGQILSFVLFGFVSGGLTIGVLASRLLQNKPALDAMERIALKTIPLEIIPLIRQWATIGKDISELLNVITDGEENTPRQPESTVKNDLNMEEFRTMPYPRNPGQPPGNAGDQG